MKKVSGEKSDYFKNLLKKAYAKGWRVGAKYGKMKQAKEYKKLMEIKVEQDRVKLRLDQTSVYRTPDWERRIREQQSL